MQGYHDFGVTMERAIRTEPGFTAAVLILTAVTLTCLVPFSAKAFHIDDTLFLRAARHIQDHPLDFYGFLYNWEGQEAQMVEVMKNPPLASYYIALVAACFGWSELPLHLAFLLPAVAAALGTYRLALLFCSRPLLAALAAVLTPVFLVSSSNIMCDTMMLAFWVWAMDFWVRGVRADNTTSLAVAAIFVVLCSMTKYFGISLLPLMLVYAYSKKRTFGRWALFLLIPVIFLACYEWGAVTLYGRALLTDAGAYARSYRALQPSGLVEKAVTVLSFTGGCLFTALCYSPLLWRRRTLAIGCVLAVLILTGLLLLLQPLGKFSLYDASGVKWLSVSQIALFTVAGISVLGVAMAEHWRLRTAETLLLLLWIAGTFVFAGFLNWTVNGRSILPMAPAVGIVLALRLDRGAGTERPGMSWQLLLPLAPAVLIALLVTRADYLLAQSSRSAAATIHRDFAGNPGSLWFQGHWGFQYYMESLGEKPLDFSSPRLAPGDRVVVPSNNSFVRPLPQEIAQLERVYAFPAGTWLATMNGLQGAGFYADAWGPLPFVFGSVPHEEYYILMVTRQEV
jgi:4-amino-4-deoxy-L-arabinose transferase-like glycosyltransferase